MEENADFTRRKTTKIWRFRYQSFANCNLKTFLQKRSHEGSICVVFEKFCTKMSHQISVIFEISVIFRRFFAALLADTDSVIIYIFMRTGLSRNQSINPFGSDNCCYMNENGLSKCFPTTLSVDF